MRIVFSFKAFDKDHDNIIKRYEFVHFLEESWKCAFRTLANEMVEQHIATKQQAPPQLLKDIIQWGNQHLDTMRKTAE